MNDDQSVVNSHLSSKSSRHKDKHCVHEQCNGKKISGTNCAKHTAIVGHQDFQACSGMEECQLCITFAQFKEVKSKHGQRKRLQCVKCMMDKDAKYVDKVSGICKVCVGGKAKSMKNFPINGSILGKRGKPEQQQHQQQDVDLATISNGVEDMDIGNDQGNIQGADQEECKEEIKEQVNIIQPASKRQAVAISQKDLQKLPKQQVTAAQLNFQVQHVPLQTQNYQIETQGQRDLQAIEQIKALEYNTTDIFAVKVQKLIELLPMFTQETVSTYVDQQKVNFPNLKDMVLQAHQHGAMLNIDQVIALAFASVILGGNPWAHLPQMLKYLDEEVIEQCLPILQALLERKFNSAMSAWICKNWQHLEAQTLPLIRYIKDVITTTTVAIPRVADIITISRAVDITDKFDTFVLVTKVFTQSPSFQLLLDSISSTPPQGKLSFDAYAVLVQVLQMNQNTMLLSINKEKLIQLPLEQWLPEIKVLQTAAFIKNCDSTQHFLDKLSEKYGSLPKKYASDILTLDPIYNRTYHQAGISPNNVQAAIAQYIAFSLIKCSKQIWSISSGQGKSRITAALTLILLLTGSTNKVHLVFDTTQLMERDYKDFSNYWQLNGLEEKVEYHVGLDFQYSAGDVLILDEADEMIFADPVKFGQITGNMNCVCLTATADNKDAQGIEREVIIALGFTMFVGYEDPAATVAPVNFNQTLKASSDLELLNFIQKELDDHPVLLYCSEQTMQFILQQQQQFISMAQDNLVDDTFLRSLDKLQQGKHALIIATGPFGMRGFDYRAPMKGITLIVAASFNNQRELMQAKMRVGRYNDPCKRILIDGVALVDASKEMQYITTLMKFCASHQTKKVEARLSAPKLIAQKKPQQLQGQSSLVSYSQRAQNMVKKSSQQNGL